MSGNSWIEAKFVETGLPRTALAEYLGLDNAAVSRIARGDRPLTTEENKLAEAFFSVTVSYRAPEIVRRLRAYSVRERVGREIVRWAFAEPRKPLDESVEPLLRQVDQGKIILRADQIVAICQREDLSLKELIEDGRIDESRSRKQERSIEELSQFWKDIAHITCAYEVGRGVNPKPKEKSPLAKSAVVLRLGSERLDAFRACTPFVVPDNSLTPQFEQGQTIYLEDRRSEPRKGDLIAVFLSDESEPEQKAVVGRFLYMSRDAVGIAAPGERTQEIDRSTIRGLRRIAFCGF